MKPSLKPDEWMPLNISAYLGDTTNLTRDQHGAYLLLLMTYWKLQGPLPDDDGQLAAIVKATPSEWKKLKPIVGRFFSIGNGVWAQKRADEELEKAQKKIAAKSDAGKAGANARWQTHSERNADANGKRIANAMADEMADEHGR